MAKIHIPQVGDEFKITKNWNCNVFNEYRNSKVFEALSIDNSAKNTHIEITLPVGTTIRIERVYVRAPASSYDSVTLRILSSPIKSLAKARFWVKLSEINKLEFEEVEMTMDSYSKLSVLERFMVVNLGKEGLGKDLSFEDKNEVYSKIFSYFKEKNKNNFVVKMNLSAEDIISTFNIPYFDRNYTSVNRDEEYRNNVTQTLEGLKEISDSFDVVLHLLPVLDKTIGYYEINEKIKAYDEKRGVFGELDTTCYWKKARLGSLLSYGDYGFYDKKTYPKLFVDNYEKAVILFNDEKKVFKDAKDFNKFFEKQRVK